MNDWVVGCLGSPEFSGSGAWGGAREGLGPEWLMPGRFVPNARVLWWG